MSRRRGAHAPRFLVFLLVGLLSGSAWADTLRRALTLEHEPINRLQVLGTHNSYVLPIDPRLVDLAAPLVEKIRAAFRAEEGQFSQEELALLAEEHPHKVDFAEGRAYDFPPLAQQLDDGMRSLEIDVYHDPKGGAFLDPAGYRRLREDGIEDLLAHDESLLVKPGLKVLHVPDLDFRSHCSTFAACIGEIAEWSDANSGHEPVFVLVELKTRAMPLFEGGATVSPFDAAAFAEIDATIFAALGRQRVITPDDVRGNRVTLNEAILTGHWPTLAEARGRFIFLLITAGDLEAHGPYLQGAASLQGRAAFLRAQPGEDHAAFLMLDNALVREAEIRARVREGYLVRTRADIETWEAKHNDPRRAKAAMRSGAQVVSTDFYQPGNRYGTDYHVSLPETDVIRRSPAFDDMSDSLH